MNYKLFIPAFILSSNVGYSQSSNSNVSVNQEFSQLAQASKTGHSFTNAFQSFNSSQVDGSQFFFPDWKTGEIVSGNNSVFSNGLMFVFDKVRQEIFIKQKDSAIVLTANKEETKSFTLFDDAVPFHFISSSAFTKKGPILFYQVLAGDTSKVMLLKYTKTTFVRADKTDMMKQREGLVYDAYVDKYSYFLVKGNGELKPIDLKVKSIKKVFSEVGINADAYLTANSQPVTEEYLSSMVKSFNN